ncbi:MAG TPA: rRNA maturation RNase YbeY [Xanthobacteraceae bacterium]|nr:rRNA maturation RNase YbeY [Xanthobacteraceae bacterium]
MNDSPLHEGEGPLAVDILIEAEAWRMLPEAEDIVRRAIACAAASGVEMRQPHYSLPGTAGGAPAVPGRRELCVLLCDDDTIARLNGQWRGQEKPTNVLSFPAPPLRGVAPGEKTPLGDIAIAYETLAREAEENRMTVLEHLSHLVVHGFLHLLGYDHHMDDEAERMERLERDILARMGVADPYVACDADI